LIVKDFLCIASTIGGETTASNSDNSNTNSSDISNTINSNINTRTMILMASASSSRSNDSASTPMTPSFHVLVALLVLGFALLALPKVSSFSPSSPPRSLASRSGGFLQSAATDTEVADTTADAAAASTRTLMEAQAGGNSSNRRRRKERIQNSDAGNQNTASFEASRAPEEVPDPLAPFASVESVRLMETPGDGDDKNVLVELVLRSDGDEEKEDPRIIDPRDLHQTSDFELWMALRKHVVDVSASQLSVVLGTNFFTSREKLLDDKIRARTSGSGSQDGDAILLNGETHEDKNSKRSNSKACAWGIKMEPLAFAQYSDVVEATNNDDDDEGTPQNRAEETGMYLMRHVDPETKKSYVFGASPDGIVTEHRLAADDDSATPQPSVGLLEIKSLWGRRHKNSLPVFDACPKRFYDQIQGQMAICDKDWCDLMLFIPPGDARGSSGRTTKKRKGKSAKKRRKQAEAAAAKAKTIRKAKGRNYSIVRVKRNEIYWNETVMPALIKFCDEVEAGKAAAKANANNANANAKEAESEEE